MAAVARRISYSGAVHLVHLPPANQSVVQRHSRFDDDRKCNAVGYFVTGGKAQPKDARRVEAGGGGWGVDVAEGNRARATGLRPERHYRGRRIGLGIVSSR